MRTLESMIPIDNSSTKPPRAPEEPCAVFGSAATGRRFAGRKNATVTATIAPSTASAQSM